MTERTVDFKVLYWNYEDVEENDSHKLIIHMGGLTAKHETVHCFVTDFTPLVYVELPERIKWTKQKLKSVYEYFQRSLKSEGPLDWWKTKKYKLRCKEEVSVLCFPFPTHSACQKFASRCRNAYSTFSIDGVGTFKKEEFKVHEHNIDPILKFTAIQKIKLSGWVSVKETIPADEKNLDVESRKFSTNDIDLYAKWTDVEPLPDKNDVVIKPKYASFDIECNSKNHNSKLPDPLIPENFIFQIATIFGRIGEQENKKILFTLFNPKNIKDVEVVRCKTEKELLLKWVERINLENVDLFIGYNIMKFDWNYMIVRAEQLEIYSRFSQISRIIGKKAALKKVSWSSSAYGEQEFRFLDAHGRIHVDVLLEIERNFKFPKYSLDYVSEFFLKQHKDDISPRQLFMLVKLTEDLTPIITSLENGRVGRKKRIEIKKCVKRILPLRRCHGEVREFRMKMMRAKTAEEFKDLIREPMTLTGSYCVQDTVLPVLLSEKLNLWTTMQEMSNCMHVPVSYLHTRGQQIKVLAQMYRETIFNNIIIPYKNKDGPTEKYQGAIVIEANPGDYSNVTCYDFASLYPSAIILKNICYTTFVENDDPTPDSECHILEWEDHRGCPHDPQHRTVKKEDVLCKKHRYRFRKVVTLPDGTRLNEGLLPRLERKLLMERKTVRKELAKMEAKLKMAKGVATPEDLAEYKKFGYEIIEKGSLSKGQMEILAVLVSVLNSQQLALKISANSMYGTLGAQTGFIPFVEGAASVTAVGRKLIMQAIEYIKTKYKNARLIYGDSVTGDTPILIKHKSGRVNYYNIDEIPRKTKWKPYEDEKEMALPREGLQVWSDVGWTPLEKIIRHKTNKKIYRVLTHTGCVDVTEDHSLLDTNGEKVKAGEVDIGDALLHADLPEIKSTRIEDSSASRCPYSMGLFYGDGSCGVYKCPSGQKASWAINNTNLDYLNKAKKELESVYPQFKFKIYDTMESSAVYKLEPTGCGVADFCREWRKYFYDNKKQKKVPWTVLNETPKNIEKFLQGYYDADGDKEYLRFDNKGGIGAAGLLFLYSRLGYSSSINCRLDKTAIYRVTLTKGKQRRDPTKIKKIWDMGECDGYVYDLQTVNHHFSAGVGKLVVHNTDSAMVTFEGLNLRESFEMGDRASKEVSHYLRMFSMGLPESYEILCPSENKKYGIAQYPRSKINELSDEAKIRIHEYDANPVNLQFENLYARYLLLTKKRYLCYVTNREGKIIMIVKKGVCSARRDNCQYLKDTYCAMYTAILDNKSEQEVLDILYDRVNALFTCRISDSHLIIYTGVSNIINYAKKKEEKQGRTITSRVFVDTKGKPIDDISGPLDDRLIYPNLPQVLLSLKMLRRGDDVPPNTRLEYLYLENPKAEHQGNKAEDYTFYKENKEDFHLRPDYLHYIEKQLMEPVGELLAVKYPKKIIVPYEKLEDAIVRCIQELSTPIRKRVLETKIHAKTIEDGVVRRKRKISKKSLREIPVKGRTYKYTKIHAQVQYILDSAAKKKSDPMLKDEVDPVEHSELISACLRWKSHYILDQLYIKHKLRKRTLKKPKQAGEKLRVRTKKEETHVVLVKKYQRYPRGSIGILKDIHELDTHSCTKKNSKKYTYDIQMEDGNVISDVPRSSITTFTYKDNCLMKDILVARTNFKNVIEELKRKGDNLNFVNA